MSPLRRLLGALACALVSSAACGSHDVDGPAPSFFGQEARSFLLEPVTLEVVPTTRSPAPAVLDLLSQRARERCSGTVKLVLETPFVVVKTGWTDSDLADLERQASQFSPRTGEAHLFVSWLPGVYLTNKDAVALTYGPHSVAVWPDVIADDPLRLSAALVHELGHALGLVRNPAHRDPAHGLHCKNRCVMFFTFSGADDFCDPCKQDLETTKRSPTP